MDCAEIRDRLRAGELPAGEAAERHLGRCAACRELVENGAAVGRALAREPAETVGSVEPDVWASLERRLAAEKGVRAWLRSRATSGRVLVAGAGATAIMLVAWLVGGGVRLAEASALWLGIFFAAAGVGLAVVLAPLGRPRLGRAPSTALAIAGLGLPLLYALSSVALAGPAPDPGGPGFAARAFGCFAFGAMLSIPFLLVLWLLDRQDFGLSRLLVRAGAVSGLVANGALVLHCPDTSPLHLVAGHAAVGLVLVLLGIAFGARPVGAAR